MVDPDVQDWERLRKAIPAIEVPERTIDESMMQTYLDLAQSEIEFDMLKSEWYQQHEERKKLEEFNDRWGSVEGGLVYTFDEEEKENSIDEAMAKSHYWANSKQEDVVNKPDHYNTGNIECIDAIEESMSSIAFQGYLKGNCMKYLWRYDYKGKPVEDLQKAQWYLARLLNVVVFEEGDE